ncbi:hypothetical protein AB1278_17550 [Chryseobacterium sp. NRRL B-14798]|uniref:hypothetical protein n=1 Tax=Chryseobacterium sp. NRRL B-14798 TaxID=3162880 RepID=UPI003D212520
MKKNFFWSNSLFQTIILISVLQSGNMFSQIGIKVTQPTAMLDVGGELRIRDLPVKSETTDLLYVDDQGYLLRVGSSNIENNVIGDIKDGIQEIDHDGWYLLDGRSKDVLPEIAKTNAKSLGFTSLPDFRNKISKNSGDHTSVGIVSGNLSQTLKKENLPKFPMSGTTSIEGSHTHNFQQKINHAPPTGGKAINLANRGGLYGTLREEIVSTLSGSHSHSNVTLNSNGRGESFPLEPKYISFRTFVYLGK